MTRCELCRPSVGHVRTRGARILRVAAPLHDARLDQAVQTGREDVGGDAETLVKVAEPVRTGEQGVSARSAGSTARRRIRGHTPPSHLGVVGLARAPQ